MADSIQGAGHESPSAWRRTVGCRPQTPAATPGQTRDYALGHGGCAGVGPPARWRTLQSDRRTAALPARCSDIPSVSQPLTDAGGVAGAIDAGVSSGGGAVSRPGLVTPAVGTAHPDRTGAARCGKGAPACSHESNRLGTA